ncbi:MAG: hypothetical protein Q7S52_02475 [bacterium]|nr:hypothetical protein [bacterium]
MVQQINAKEVEVGLTVARQIEAGLRRCGSANPGDEALAAWKALQNLTGTLNGHAELQIERHRLLTWQVKPIYE